MVLPCSSEQILGRFMHGAQKRFYLARDDFSFPIHHAQNYQTFSYRQIAQGNVPFWLKTG